MCASRLAVGQVKKMFFVPITGMTGASAAWGGVLCPEACPRRKIPRVSQDARTCPDGFEAQLLPYSGGTSGMKAKLTLGIRPVEPIQRIDLNAINP